MNGAKVTVYVTNCGNGTADVQAVMQGTTGTTSTQYYLGISTVDPADLNFALTVDSSHLVSVNKIIFNLTCRCVWEVTACLKQTG